MRPFALSFSLLLSLLVPLHAQAVGQSDGPEADSTLVGAGFMDSHPDIMYRQWAVAALHRGDASDAMKNFRLSARYADKPSQGYIGEMYWFGVNMPADPVLAFAWMDVAAERGYPLFVDLRDQYWASLPLERQQDARSQAQALRAEFGDAVAKPRIAEVLRRGMRQMTGSRTGSMSNNVDIVFSEGGINRTIKADRLYDPKYWDPVLYQKWQDDTWMKIRRGSVQVGYPTQAGAVPAPAEQEQEKP
ncbi:sel1 repeat family protein [Stenotrophomonas sp.]|uniref:sel1 repeat family protein n=1 Tax=Stenotrophomonas sp. TaxID=69392 RepID=UPI00289A6005|nr:sel1 repeat family protein [Stenotrophomonas sp.]